MRRNIFCSLILLSLPACGGIFGSDPDEPPRPITELPRALTAAERSSIEASNTFGFDLLRELADEDRTRSVFISPISASMALGMTMNGAAGETFDAMRSTLRLTGLSETQINESYRDLLDLFTELDPSVDVAIANSIWHREGLSVQAPFRERVTSYFDSRVEALDFGSPSAPTRINDWVRSATRGKIEEMAPSPIPGNVIVYLMNAVYFEAGWTTPFDPRQTRTAPFHLENGGTASVQMMVRDDTIRSAFSDRWAAADLPYGGGAFSMTVVVPRGETSVHSLLEEADAGWWEELTSSFTVGRTLLSLPRFELEWEGVMNDALETMGMGVAFDGAADFSRMFGGVGLWIDEVRQKSFLQVDEEGTVAAAVTSVTGVTSLPPEVRADRPFLFAIRERLSGTILFMGAIVEAPQGP